MANSIFFRLLDRPLPPSRPLGSLGREFGGLGSATLRVLSASLGAGPATPLGTLGGSRRSRLEELLRRRRLGRFLARFRLARIGEKRRWGGYQGVRHGLGLPVRGQRTHSNGRTARRLLRPSP